jgi:hypothetical protein
MFLGAFSNTFAPLRDAGACICAFWRAAYNRFVPSRRMTSRHRCCCRAALCLTCRTGMRSYGWRRTQTFHRLAACLRATDAGRDGRRLCSACMTWFGAAVLGGAVLALAFRCGLFGEQV